jgi:hypothetical protein
VTFRPEVRTDSVLEIFPGSPNISRFTELAQIGARW